MPGLGRKPVSDVAVRKQPLADNMPALHEDADGSCGRGVRTLMSAPIPLRNL